MNYILPIIVIICVTWVTIMSSESLDRERKAMLFEDCQMLGGSIKMCKELAK